MPLSISCSNLIKSFKNGKRSLFSNYVIFITGLILFASLSFGLYSQLKNKAKINLAYTTSGNLVRSNRFLSFQGRLTDTSGNPITSSTSIVFKLFDTEAVGTGTSLYTSSLGNSQTVIPDDNGIFSVTIGKTHGLEIPASVFTEHPEVFLEITAGAETMSPRQPIATVAYALNSETLQGLPPSASGLKDTVLILDSDGNLNLGETSPSIKSTSGTLGIEGQAVLLKASDGSGGNIEINPDANGIIKLITEGTGTTAPGFISASNANLNTGNLFNADIRNTNRSYNFISFQNFDTGTTNLNDRFYVNAYGDTLIGRNLTVSNNISVGATLNSINISIGNTLISSTANEINFLHNLTPINGSIIVGTGSSFTNLTIGTSNYVLTSNGSTPFWADTSTLGTTYTAGNGITLSGTEFKLGGFLTENTSIGTSSFSLSFLDDNNVQSLYLSSSGNVGIGTAAANGTLKVVNSTGIFNSALYYSGSAYTDRTLDSQNSLGTAYTILAGTTTRFYVGKDIPFDSIFFDIGTSSTAGRTLVVEYSQGGGNWNTVAVTDGTNNSGTLRVDGAITFTSPADWATDTVNSSSPYYWIRLSCSNDPGTDPTAYATTLTQKPAFQVFATQGINETTPSFFIGNNGNISIKNANPGTYALNITGTQYVSSTITASGVITTSSDLQVQGSDVYDNSGDLHLSGEDNVFIKLDYNNDDTDTRAIIFAKNTNLGIGVSGVNELMRINENGNIGIGTSAPTSKLHVNGNTLITGNLTVGANFVSVGSTNLVTNLNADFLDGFDSTEFLTIGQTGSLPYDNYQYWTANVGTSSLNLGSTSTLTFAAGTGLSATLIGNTLTFTNTGVGTTYTATNGLSLLDTNTFGFGGTLTQNTFINLASYDLSFLGLGNTQSLFIDTNGFVGIGTTTPTQALHISQSNINPSILFEKQELTLVQGPLSPGAGTDIEVSYYPWVNPGNILSNDNTYSEVSGIFSTGTYDYEISLMINGSLMGDNKADVASTWPHVDTYANYGSPTDLWGLSITPSDINDSDFGISLQVQDGGYTHYLQATNFNFNIPTDHIIKGIVAQIERKDDIVNHAGLDHPEVDHIQISIYHTKPNSAWSIGSDNNDNKFKISNSNLLGINDKLVIDNVGNIGIGTTNPLYSLDINGSVRIGSTFVSVGSTNLVTNLNADLLDGYHASSFLSIGQTGTLPYDNYNHWKLQVNGLGTTDILSGNTVNFIGGTGVSLSRSGSTITINNTSIGTTYDSNNGITKSINNIFQLGGALTQNTRLNIGNTESIYIAYPNGNVGLGTTSPTAKLHVNGDLRAISLRLDQYGNQAFYLSNNKLIFGNALDDTLVSSAASADLLSNVYVLNNNYYRYANTAASRLATSNGGFTFYTLPADLTSNPITWTGNEKLTLLNSGNLGLGTTNPTSKLHVTGSANVTANLTVGGTFVSVGSTNLVTNLNADLLDGNHASNFLSIGQTGSLPYDNYNHWKFQVNGLGTTNVLSGNTVNFVNGIGISLSQTGSTVTINNIGVGTTYTTTNGLTLSSGQFKLGGALTEATRLNIGSTEVLYLSINGNVGIGTTNPNSRLSVYHNFAATSIFNLSSDTSSLLDIEATGKFNYSPETSFGLDAVTFGGSGGYSTTNYFVINPSLNNTGNIFNVQKASNSLLLISSGGYVGIGTTSPSKKLDISGDLKLTGTIFTGVGVTGTNGQVLASNGAGGLQWVDTNGVGTTYTVTNGLSLISADIFGLGGTLTQNTQIGTSSFGLSFLGLGNTQSLFIKSNGNIGLGTTNPLGPFHIKVGTTEALFVKNNSYIGIGNSNPTGPFHIKIGSTEAFFVKANGNVGIGTTNPLSMLTIDKAALGNYEALRLGNPNPNNVTKGVKIRFDQGNGLVGYISNGYNYNLFTWTMNFSSGNSGVDMLTIENSGNVGIGTTNPSKKLDVIGDVKLTGSVFVGTGVTGTSGQVLTSNGAGSLTWTTPTGSTYTAGNGITLSGTQFKLGGTLTQNTSIGTSSFDLTFLDLNNIPSLSIKSSGNIGIGTTNPTSKLHIVGSADITSSLKTSQLIVNPTGVFLPKTDLFGVYTAVSIDSSDFNNDGFPDLVVANSGVTSVSVFINNGDNTFATKVDYLTGTNPHSVTSADFNNDNFQDIAVANQDSNSISIFLNNGNGTFAAKVDYPATSSVRSVTAADLNGDDYPDLAVTNGASNSVSIYMNLGNGTFGTQVNYITGNLPYSASAADFNHDNSIDLAVANLFSNNVSILLNNGDGTFASKVDYTVDGMPQSVSSGNYNGDNIPDFAVTNSDYNSVSVFINNGDGTFASKVDYTTGTTPYSVTSGNFNDDNFMDLATANTNSNDISVLINNGDGTFASKVDYHTGYMPWAITTSDLNHDDKQDLVATNYNDGSVSIFYNNFIPSLFTSSSGFIGMGTTLPTARLEVAGAIKSKSLIFNENNRISNLLGFQNFINFSGGIGTNDTPRLTAAGNIKNISSITAGQLDISSGGIFAPKVDYPINYWPVGVAAFHFNNDEIIDLVTANSGSTTVSVLTGNSNGTFNTAIDFVTGFTSTHIASDDFNNDDKPDLAILGDNYTFSVLLNNGDNTFAQKVDYEMENISSSIKSSDFNRDGNVDLLLISGNIIYIFYNNGDGAFNIRDTYSVGNGISSLDLSDLNGDGNKDIVFASSMAVFVLLNNGDGTFATGVSYPIASNSSKITTSDFNGDNKLDIAATDYDNNSVSILLNNGDGTFAAKVDYSTGSNPSSITSADFNGDGKSDLAVSNYSSHTISLLLNNGDGTFTAKVDYSAGYNPSSITSADFNGDGKSDLAVLNTYDNTVSVLLNIKTPILITNTSGSVGIGTTNPIEKLEVIGNLKLGSKSTTLVDQSFNSAGFPPTGFTVGVGGSGFARDTINFYSSSASAASNIGTTLPNSGLSWMQTGITIPDNNTGTVEFYWKVSSESNWDYLAVCIDNPTCTRSSGYTQRISGAVDWTKVILPLSSGSHTIRWIYNKDSSSSDGLDTGWVDNIILSSQKLNEAGKLLLTDGFSTSPILTFINSPKTGIFSSSLDSISIGTSGVERLKIDSSGNVGIGHPNPTAKLDILNNSSAGTTGPEIITDAADRDFSVDTGHWTGTNWSIGSSAAYHIIAGTDPFTLSTGISMPSSGHTYRVSLTIGTTNSGTLDVYFGNDWVTIGGDPSYTGVQDIVFYSYDSDPLIIIPDYAWTGNIKNISIKEIFPSTPSQVFRRSNGAVALEIRNDLAGGSNTFIGLSAGRNLTNGLANTALGYDSLSSNYSGNQNTAMGSQSLMENTSGSDNSAFGTFALKDNLVGHNNSAFGKSSLDNNITGSYNSAFGSGSLLNNISGNNNTAIGVDSLLANKTGSNNSAFGYNSLESNSNGWGNTAGGKYSLYRNTSGFDNVAYGISSLEANTTGSENTALGAYVGYNFQTGSNNLFLGNYAARGWNTYTNANNNTIIGYQAGYGIVSNQSGNVFLGYQAGYNETGSNKLYIANSNVGNPLIYGDFSTGNVGIGTTNPTSKLEINGDLSLTDNNSQILWSFNDADKLYFYDSAYRNKIATEYGYGTKYYAGNIGTTSVVNEGYHSFLTDSNGVWTERLRINGNGNVGIGTTNPTANLEVTTSLASPDGLAHFFAPSLSNGSYAQLRIGKSTGTNYTSTISYVPNATAGLSSLRLGLYGSSNTMTITGNGNVGIGNINPLDKLDIGTGSIRWDSTAEPANYYARSYFNINGSGNANLTFLGFQVHSWPSGTVETPLALTGAGRVGIGTTSPNAPLDVSAIAGLPAINVGRATGQPNIKSTSDYLIMDSNTNAAALNYWSTQNVYLAYGNGSGGNVGIGTISPTAKLEVAGRININAGGSTALQINSGGDLIISAANGGTATTLYNDTGFLSANTRVWSTVQIGANNLLGGQTVAYVDAAGYVIRNASDIKMKEDIEPLTDGLEKVLRLRGVTFYWKDKERMGINQEIGFIAQEVQSVAPQLVSDGGDYLSLKTPEITALLVEGMKEQQLMIESNSQALKNLVITKTGDIYYDYNVSSEVLSSLGYDDTKNEIEAAKYYLTDSIGNLVDRIAQFSELAVAKLKAGLIIATNVVSNRVISDTSISNETITSLISPLSGESNTIIIDAGVTVTSTLSADTLESQNASISGTLYADNIISSDGSITDLMSSQISSLRDELKKFVAESNDVRAIQESPLLSESQNWPLNLGVTSVSLTGDISLSNNLILAANLTIKGSTQLANAFVTGTFTAGQIALKDNFIETTNTALYLQPSNTGSVHIMADTLVIAENGEVTINGNLHLNGSLVAQTGSFSNLMAKLITAEEIDVNHIKIATDSASTIIAESGFASLATTSAQLNSNATAGTAILPAGKTELLVNNNKLTDSSMVYLTPVGSTDNQVIYVKDKNIDSALPNFTIALDKYLDHDVAINWWIIN